MTDVTFCFVEQSTAGTVTLSKDATLANVREQVPALLQSRLEEQWGVADAIDLNLETTVIVSDTHGFLSCEDDSKAASELCGNSLIALVPSPQIIPSHDPLATPYMVVPNPPSLQCPLLDRKNYAERDHPACDHANDAMSVLQRLERLEQDTQDLREEKKQSRQEVHDLKGANNQLRQEVRDLKGANNQLRQEVCDLKGANNRLEQKNTELTRQHEKLEAELKEQKVGLIAANNKLAGVHNQLNSMMAQNVTLAGHIKEMEVTQQEHTGWIYSNDTVMLDRIKARHLLNMAQARLACIAGVSATPFPAFDWREAIGPSEELSARLAKARNLLKDIRADTRTSRFIQTVAGMNLVCEYSSTIRKMGNEAAHPSIQNAKFFRDSVSHHDQSDGLTDILNFVCTS